MSEIDTSREAVERLARGVEDIAARTNMGYAKDPAADALRALLAERDALQANVDAAYTTGFEAAREMAAKKACEWVNGDFGMSEIEAANLGVYGFVSLISPQQKEGSDE